MQKTWEAAVAAVAAVAAEAAEAALRVAAEAAEVAAEAVLRPAADAAEADAAEADAAADADAAEAPITIWLHRRNRFHLIGAVMLPLTKRCTRSPAAATPPLQELALPR